MSLTILNFLINASNVVGCEGLTDILKNKYLKKFFLTW